MTAEPPNLWRWEAVGPRAVLDTAADALSQADPPLALAVTLLDAPADERRLELLTQGAPDSDALRAAGGLDDPRVRISVSPVPEADWIAKSLEGLPLVEAGRFVVRGGHHAPPAGGRIDVCVEAGQAFGTGHHGTTRGCLLALDHMLKRQPAGARRPLVLDVGTGAGVLAIAAAKASPALVLATDIDPIAVAITRENARLNGVSRRIRALHADGLAHPALRARRFDALFANILARPLVSLAPALSRAAAPGAWLILSGLLTGQQRLVLGAYRHQGWRLERTWLLGEWATLLLRWP